MRTQYIRGFTIVELLIVVVVIAILAAITIISFNGIQQRARTAALQSNVATTARYLSMEYAVGGQYPSDYGNKDGVIYELTSSGETFCLSGTKDGISYYATNANLTPAEGRCEGHEGHITNLVLNPSFEVDKTGWAATRADTTVVSGAGRNGGKVLRVTVNAVGYVPRTYIANSHVSPVTPGKSYRISAWVKSSAPVVMLAQPLNTSYSNAGSSVTKTFSMDNTWKNITMTISVPDPSAVSMTIWVGFETDTAIGTSLDLDSIMMTEGTNEWVYADGDSPGWSWSGTPGASTSSGPPL